MYRTVVTICTAQRSLYVPHSGHYMYRTAATICTAQRSLYVPHSGHYMYSPVVTICTASLTFTIPRSAHTVYLCVLCGSENKQRWRSCLRHCATSRNVACSIPDGVIAVFHWHNPSGRTMILWSNHRLTQINTRNNSLNLKAAGVSNWYYHLHVPTLYKSRSPNILGPYRPVRGL